MKTLITVVFLCIASHLYAGEPSVTLYQKIEEDMEWGTSPELILKVNNPTKQTFYVLGLSITDIPYRVEILKGGKWEAILPTRCGTSFSLRKFLPDSSIVFTAYDAPLIEKDVTFRLRVYLYIEPDIRKLYTDPKHESFVELVSPPFSTNDFHKKLEEGSVLPPPPSGETESTPSPTPATTP